MKNTTINTRFLCKLWTTLQFLQENKGGSHDRNIFHENSSGIADVGFSA